MGAHEAPGGPGPRGRAAVLLGLLFAGLCLGGAGGCGEEQGRAAPEGSPARPALPPPASVAPSPEVAEGATREPPARPPASVPRCEALSGGLTRLALEAPRAGHLPVVVTRRGRGSAGLLEGGRQTLRVLAARDVNGDGRDDYVVQRGADECGNLGECVLGLIASCAPEGHVEALALDYRMGLAPEATWTEVDGARWLDLRETRRLAGDMEEEAERFEEGRPLVEPVLWHATPDGYVAGRPGAAGYSDRCHVRVREGAFSEARAYCERGLELARSRRLRGAIFYDLGRIAEGLGDLAAAREAYARSLAERPGNALVRARLQTLTPPPPPP